MLNKPKFGLTANVKYALQGMRDVLKSETSFKIQLCCIAILSAIILFTPIEMWKKSILILSMFPILITEAVNSAIERVVDMFTKEHNELAREAKDIGAFAVLLTFILTVAIWGVTLFIL